MYFVKTHNWSKRVWTKRLLDLSLRLGVRRGDRYSNEDGKFTLETKSAVRAWSVWIIFHSAQAIFWWVDIYSSAREID